MNPITRTRVAAVGLAVAVLSVVTGGVAVAQVEAGFITDAFDDIQSTIVSVAVPALLGLTVAVTVAMVAMRWIKKARSSAS